MPLGKVTNIHADVSGRRLNFFWNVFVIPRGGGQSRLPIVALFRQGCFLFVLVLCLDINEGGPWLAYPPVLLDSGSHDPEINSD